MKYARRISQVASLLVLALITFFLWEFAAYGLDWYRFHRALDRHPAIFQTDEEWESSALHNTWGNALYAFHRPNSSDLKTMQRLEDELREVVRSATDETDNECIDRMYLLLADAMPDEGYEKFVRRHHEAYRAGLTTKQK